MYIDFPFIGISWTESRLRCRLRSDESEGIGLAGLADAATGRDPTSATALSSVLDEGTMT